MSQSARASWRGVIARCIAMIRRSPEAAPRSLRSSVVVAGRTRSACRAVAVQNGSWTMTVSGLAQPRRSRLRS
ncbi:Uncharacterised protein [Mycobacteroides abscessus subsp. abscessus]|nr:Uncharacterised protein [Mycobacteroides abscessus subsp. abscessus]